MQHTDLAEKVLSTRQMIQIVYGNVLACTVQEPSNNMCVRRAHRSCLGHLVQYQATDCLQAGWCARIPLHGAAAGDLRPATSCDDGLCVTNNTLD